MEPNQRFTKSPGAILRRAQGCASQILRVTNIHLETELVSASTINLRTRFCLSSHTLMRRYYLTMLLVVYLTGCASTRAPVIPPVDTSFTVQINKQFDSLPNYSRIYFQGGMQVPKTALDRWTTYCRLHVFNPDMKADYLSSVAPGIFTISRVFNRVESSDYPVTGSGFYVFAGIGLSRFNSSFGFDRELHDPPSYYLYRVEMKLTSPEQPDVQTLICSKKWSTRGNYYPTLVEIRHALGDLIEIIPLLISSNG